VSRFVHNFATFWRGAPWTVRLSVLASVILLAIALAMFAVGQPVIGVIAAGLYVFDLAVVGPGLMMRRHREARTRRSRQASTDPRRGGVPPRSREP
jgi:hypothetical protein